MADNLEPYNRCKSLVVHRNHLSTRCDYCDVGQVVTIHDLPDDVLLAIFDFYVVPYQDLGLFVVGFNPGGTKKKVEWWQLLVHVCRRWRGLVFGSPRRLNLQLFYEPRTSASRSLVWPALPLIIKGDVFDESVDNVIAELKHSNRVSQIYLRSFTNSVWTAMQVPFPELEFLYLKYENLMTPVLPDSFLGGSAPRLRYLSLTSISFPGLPKLLLSATHLVCLYLNDIARSGYISPEAMATCLSTLTGLEMLQLLFQPCQPGPDRERPPPPTRAILPVLTVLRFNGASHEYLEELAAWIDTPRLRQLSATFFYDMHIVTPELIRLVSHSSTLNAPNEAHVVFGTGTASVRLQPRASKTNYFEVNILSSTPGWQLLCLSQICTSSSPLLSTTENLYIYEDPRQSPNWKGAVENTKWLGLLLPFASVTNVYLSKQFAPRIAPALQELTGGRATEVLPSLHDLYLEGFQPSESVQEGIERFISARQLTNHPVAISVWKRGTMGE